ncbi:relA-associated inhibitor [Eudromia elegans]
MERAQDLLELTFQSLAMRHMDLKQVELDTAVAKVDELSRQLESLWSDGPGPPAAPPKDPYSPLEALGRPGSPRSPYPVPSEERAPSPRPKVLPVPPEGLAPPRGPLYELLGAPRDAPSFCPPERAPSPRPPPPPPYELHGLYPAPGAALAPFRAQDDLGLRRRPQKSWNESDLDVAYEKKPAGSGGYDRATEGPLGLRQPLAPWRESSLDGAGGQGKDGAGGGAHSATLPRNYKVSPGSPVSPLAGGGRRAGPGGGTLPRGWHPALQPASRVPVPPPPAPPPAPGARAAPPRHKPLPLSMIFKLQNAFWERGGPPPARAPPKQLPPPPAPLPPPEAPGWPLAADGSGSGASSSSSSAAEPPRAASSSSEGPARPLSPTRLPPRLPPVAAFGDAARALAHLPRPLKRRGSMEQSPAPAPPHKAQYQQLISRLFHHRPRRDEDAAADTPAAAAAAGDAPPETPPEPPGSPMASPERRSALRGPTAPPKRPKGRVRLEPLALLLDAALTGELDVVQQAVAELQDASQPNAEGITALHNAICGANYDVVDFLIASGANVNSPDSHGWTPLHCAASCNDTAVCVALVRHGAAVFATTAGDGSVPAEKCDPYREGYADCYSYLCEVEQGMGVLNSGVVYALWDYSAELGDELSFREGEPVTVLRREPPAQLHWWWGSLYGHEGYVPKNYFGLFPRVRPQRKKV